MQPKKQFGQNFLRSEGALLAIVTAGDLSKKDTVLEIGPGEGALTEQLLKKAGKVIAIEKDRDLIFYLTHKFTKEIKSKKLILVEDDIRDTNIKKLGLKNHNFKLIANIPYYITGEIFRSFLQAKIQPSLIVLLVQKEVAQRIVANNKKESILSISVKVYGKPKIIKIVPRGSFYPMPTVDSAILKINDISKKYFAGLDEKHFFEILHAGFQYKRKKLLSNLSKKFDKNKTEIAFQNFGFDHNIRAEDLKLEHWGKIAERI